MRFNLLARRILVPALGLALAATVAACSSSGSSATTSSSSAAAPAATSGSAAAPSSPGGGNSAAVAQITANWEKFFNSSTSASEKATLLQNGTTFEPVIQALINFPLASGLGAKVTSVTLKSATTATVKYNLTASGQALFTQDQTGTAVLQGGTWKVGDASLCSLFRLIPGGTVPSACSSVG
ncbi:MAG TPA: hypothetical protein VF951_17965 [Streptosporangiaceae bacterium]